MVKLRQAVLDKNFYWFNRYRTVDGYSIFGGRADLRFTDGQTNRVVAQREMEVLDVMTANRDQRIWAVAQGKDLAVDDSNTPPFIPVKTNKPGAGPNGEHIFLAGEEAIGQMTIGKNLKVNLFASEQEFPELAKPVQMSFDSRGRLWVACWPTYPHWKPKEEMNDKLLILEDTDGDGKADKKIVFADGLHCPTGFEFANGGVLIAQAPDLMFLKDTDGDDKADVRERVLSGLDSADTHHTSNSFQLDPGGGLYFQEGTFHQTQVETPYGPPVRCSNAGVFRYEPKSQKFDVYVSFGFANPARPRLRPLGPGHRGRRHGLCAHSRHAVLGPCRLSEQACRSASGLSAAHPADPRHRVLEQPALPRGIPGKPARPQRDRLPGHSPLQDRGQGRQPGRHRAGADPLVPRPELPAVGYRSRARTERSTSSTGRTRSSATCSTTCATPAATGSTAASTGSLMKAGPLSTAPKIAGASIEELLDLLKHPEDRVRYRARTELGARDAATVVAALEDVGRRARQVRSGL